MMQAAIFYILGALAVVATAVAITRKNGVHAVLYLVNALLALALMFYQLGAPLIAAWEVIIYAGAIMVLFLFVIMMFREHPPVDDRGNRRVWVPFVLLALLLVVCAAALVFADPLAVASVPTFAASPRAFGEGLFGRYALGVEILSFQLLYAAVGAYIVGRSAGKT
jgi:NADH-quinone oxidoreductase subunit J